jgi:heme exporter protein D
MSINGFVASAYGVFAAVLVWDYLAPRIQLARARRAIALRIRRDAGKKPAGITTP